MMSIKCSECDNVLRGSGSKPAPKVNFNGEYTILSVGTLITYESNGYQVLKVNVLLENEDEEELPVVLAFAKNEESKRLEYFLSNIIDKTFKDIDGRSIVVAGMKTTQPIKLSSSSGYLDLIVIE